MGWDDDDDDEYVFFDYTLLMFFSVSHFGIGGLLIFGDILSQETFIQFWVFSGYG